MKLRYMVEYALRDGNTNPHYEPIRVWVQGPGPGLDLAIRYSPGNEEAEGEADWVINRLVEAGVRSLSEDFLDYHRDAMPPYRGICGEIAETESSMTSEAWATSALEAHPDCHIR